MILISSSIAVSEGVESTFAGLKKKKKKPVGHLTFYVIISMNKFFFSLSMS